MLNTTRHAQRGETLVGLMVGMTVGLIVTAASLAMLISTLSLNAQAINNSYLNQELKTIMDLMVRDVRRAQYSGTAMGCIGGASCTNAFSGGTEDWTVAANQVDYTYDENSNGTQDSGECSGFRRAVVSGVGRVEKKNSCTPTWQPLSDEKSTSIDDLRFSVSTTCIAAVSPGTGFLAVRVVKIYLQGSQAGATRRMCQKVKIKNDLATAACTATTLSTAAPFDICPP